MKAPLRPVKLETCCQAEGCGHRMRFATTPGTVRIVECTVCRRRWRVLCSPQPLGLAEGGSAARFGLRIDPAPPALSTAIRQLLQAPPPPRS